MNELPLFNKNKNKIFLKSNDKTNLETQEISFT